MDDKQNANPTILSLSDLPSRRSESNVKRRDDGSTGLFDGLVPHYSYLNDPFDEPLSSTDSDDDSVEDIDEQEVYGMFQGPAGVMALNAYAKLPSCRPDLFHLRP